MTMVAVDHSAFLFRRYDWTPENGELRLHYAYENGAAFEEIIQFPPAARALSDAENAALDKALRLVFLLAGVSYAKAYAPATMRCEAFALDVETAALIEKIYFHGLGEFAYRNDIDLRHKLKFTDSTITAPPPVPSFDLSRRALVAVGGGKDSIVSIETLKAARMPMELFAVGGAGRLAAPIAATIETAGVPALRVARTLSPALLELNKKGALNGHVPITAIVSALGIVTALRHGFDAVVFSNERSASAPNIRMYALEVNHQYSKSAAFEDDFAAYVRHHIAADLNYFSLLRPFSEAEIARRFARLTPYHSVFRSCNAAFRQDEKSRATQWCGECPKCRFVFLALAPFLEKHKLTALFGKNLLDDPAHREGFATLCGLAAHKPFECVGEVEESALLLEQLAHMKEWNCDAVVAALAPKLAHSPAEFTALYNELFAAHPAPNIPADYRKALNAHRGSAE